MQRDILKIYVILILIICVDNQIRSQNISLDIDTVLNHSFARKQVVYKPKFLFIPDKKIIKYNPVSLAFGSLMYFYQRVISPQLSSNCPYEISCSNYSKVVIDRYGIIKGIALTSYRLMRCNRMAAKDISPLNFDKAGKIIDDPEQYKLK
jgi:putative component of membrane protein insertase Oxa1/YidC/SpoIIIJ protein YidD